MKFYDRINELETLAQIEKQSSETACFTIMIGRRRIGKTSLLLRSSEGKRLLYLFVSRNSEAVLCNQFQQQANEALGLQIYGTVNRFADLFEQLLIFAQHEHYTLIIDEFQDFNNINRAIFSEIQNLWDKYKDRVKLNFIACGSIYSLMMKIFENNKEPLFGRLTSKIVLKPFTISVIKGILKDYNPTYTADDLLFLYTLTGGVSHYIALLMNAKAVTFKKMLDFVTRSDSPFLNEGKELLVSEFGRDYSTYFSILQLIATGKTTQSEIDSIIGKNTGAYLANLENQYSLIVRNKPMFSKPESRNSHWTIGDNFLRFWFRFIYPNQSLIEMGKFDLLRLYITNNYEQYSGLLLEKYFRQKFAEEETITTIGNFWDNGGENEIDLIALNDFDRTAIIAEIKRNPKKISLQTLAMKTAAIQKSLAKYEVSLKALSLNDM
ncbi:MAG: ATP-binding protein [Bacteroidetes bacterium]|nr:ATP-binding protein [Bacteroidota bacterium]MCL2302633.1 ATP-binding protein [Lentimicrobiaceae bacterium]